MVHKVPDYTIINTYLGPPRTLMLAIYTTEHVEWRHFVVIEISQPFIHCVFIPACTIESLEHRMILLWDPRGKDSWDSWVCLVFEQMAEHITEPLTATGSYKWTSPKDSNTDFLPFQIKRILFYYMPKCICRSGPYSIGTPLYTEQQEKPQAV